MEPPDARKTPPCRQILMAWRMAARKPAKVMHLLAGGVRLCLTDRTSFARRPVDDDPQLPRLQDALRGPRQRDRRLREAGALRFLPPQLVPGAAAAARRAAASFPFAAARGARAAGLRRGATPAAGPAAARAGARGAAPACVRRPARTGPDRDRAGL